MTLKSEKYIIATRFFPLLFEDKDNDGNDIGNIEEAYFYDTYNSAETELDRFDEPESRQILKVNVTYEF